MQFQQKAPCLVLVASALQIWAGQWASTGLTPMGTSPRQSFGGMIRTQWAKSMAIFVLIVTYDILMNTYDACEILWNPVYLWVECRTCSIAWFFCRKFTAKHLVRPKSPPSPPNCREKASVASARHWHLPHVIGQDLFRNPAATHPWYLGLKMIKETCSWF